MLLSITITAGYIDNLCIYTYFIVLIFIYIIYYKYLNNYILRIIYYNLAVISIIIGL